MLSQKSNSSKILRLFSRSLLSFSKSFVFLVIAFGGAVDLERGLRHGISSMLLSISVADYPAGLAPARISFAFAIASGSPVPGNVVADTVLGYLERLEPGAL